MAIEIVDGHTGTAHITSDDIASLNVGLMGSEQCVFEWGEDLSLAMASPNSATLGTGAGMVRGRRFLNPAAATLAIESGTQGQRRNDLVVARYAKGSDGRESVSPVVVKGTPTTGTPADPDVQSGDLRLWRIPLDGVNVGSPVRLASPTPTLAELGASEEVAVTAAATDMSYRSLIASRRGRVCVYTLNVEYTDHDWQPDDYTFVTVPESIRPAREYRGVLYTFDSSWTWGIAAWVLGTDGTIKVSGGKAEHWYGQIVWVI